MLNILWGTLYWNIMLCQLKLITYMKNAEYFIRLLNFSPSFASIKVLAAKYENRVTVQCFLAIPINFSQFNDRVFFLWSASSAMFKIYVRCKKSQKIDALQLKQMFQGNCANSNWIKCRPSDFIPFSFFTLSHSILNFPFRPFSIIYLTFPIHVDIFGVGHFKGFLITAYGEA